jgi:hypothetical protein
VLALFLCFFLLGEPRFAPAGALLSFALPKESEQRKGERRKEPRSGPVFGSPFFCLLFFGRSKEKWVGRRAETWLAQQAKTTRKNQQPTNQETANGTRCATAQSSS